MPVSTPGRLPHLSPVPSHPGLRAARTDEPHTLTHPRLYADFAGEPLAQQDHVAAFVQEPCLIHEQLSQHAAGPLYSLL